ncbi:MAG: subtilisin-like proprotein convertase family protein [Paracoccaceae bacterium]|jgi:subtilisin-like proprotein convertase family protein
MRLLFCLLGLLASQLLQAQVPFEEIRIEDVAYEVACDELQCHPASGRVAHTTKIPDQGTATKTRSFAQALAVQSKNRFDLVIYPKGQKRSKANRRVLTRRILVEREAAAAPDAIAASSGARSSNIPEFAPNYLILEFANSGDSLTRLGKVRETAGVLSAQPLLAKSRKKRFVPNDPRYAHSGSNPRYQWHLDNTGQNGATAGIDVNITTVWDTYQGSGILVGIVDDGLETSHPDLSANTNTAIDHDWNDATPDDPTPFNTIDDHGTACAGVAAGRGNNGIGGTGAAPQATLVGLRLIAGDVSDAEEAEAMNWRNDLISIKSNSWGPFDNQGTLDAPGPLVKAALKSSVESGRGGLGTVHFWAAGNGYANDNVNYDAYASSIYTIAIGAVTDRGERSDYSEPGASKVVSAPSNGGRQGITTTTLVASGRYTDDFGGTSSATPLAAGVCALILEANPALRWRDFQEILIRSAFKVRPADSGWKTNAAGIDFNHEFGAGMIDAQAAVTLATGWTNLPDQEEVTLASGPVTLAIPDDSSSGTSTTFDLSSAQALRVEHVTLTANITHARRGQLTLSLISPSGTESFLTMPNTGTGANFSNWTMMTVHNWGENSQGIWTLKVVDSSAGRTGTLSNATLKVFGAPTTAITDPPSFSHAATASGTAGGNFNFQVLADKGANSFTAADLPPGLSINQTTGLISGTPTTEGDFSVALTATNANGTSHGAVMISIEARIPTPPVISGATSATGIIGLPFSYQIVSSHAPTSYQATPLPPGLILNSGSGFISGNPTTVGTTSVTLTASNSDGSDSASLLITIQAPGSGPLAQGLDTTGFIFETSGTGEWLLDTATSVNGSDSVASSNISDDGFVTFSTTITGPGLFTFAWKVSSEEGYDVLSVALDGDEQNSISGDIDWTETVLIIPKGDHTVAWTYEKDFLDSIGADKGWVDHLRFTPGSFSRTLGQALDYPGLVWTSGGDKQWTGQVNLSHDGEDSAQAGNLDDNEDSVLQVELEGPGTFSFYYRVDSEEDYDFLRFTLDGSEQLAVSGNVSWTQEILSIPAGAHTLSWRYEKDGSELDGADSAWVDQVLWLPDGIGSYQQWSNLNFSLDEQADPELGMASADADHDGQANLLEYAFNTDPWTAETQGGPRMSSDGMNLSLDFRIDSAKDDITYQTESSSDMSDWSEIPSTLISTNDTIQNRRATQAHNEGNLFLRIVVSQIP